MKQKVAEFLKAANEPKTPTQIGMALGQRYTQASSSVSPALKSLVKEGRVIRTVPKAGVVLYQWNPKQVEA